MWWSFWQAQLLATYIILCLVVNDHRCNGQEESDCCEDISEIITSDNKDELEDCDCVIGDVVIDLSGETDLNQSYFSFLDNLMNVTGIFSLKNVALSNQIVVIGHLQHIGGDGVNITHSSALSVVNVSGGDIIFPNLTVINRGNAVFDIVNDNEVCGFRGINWSSILSSDSRINESNCKTPNCSSCQDCHCWSDKHCQFGNALEVQSCMMSGKGDDDESFLDMILNADREILIGVGAGIVVMLLLCLCCCCACCCYCCRKKQNKYNISMTAVGMEDAIDTGIVCQQTQNTFDLPSLKLVTELMDPPKLGKISVVPLDALEQSQLIGNGSCGQVYKGHWHTETDTVSYLVAIKVFGTPSTNYQKLINTKLDKFSVLEHENVLRLCSVSLNTQLMMAYEYVPYNLRQYLVMNKQTLSAKNLISLSTQIAKGMAYLSSKGISHGNLAARNVMIQQGSTAKITDYNLFDLTAQSDWVPVRWLAPETLRYRKYDEKSDMWSYGVTVWEIMTFGAQPYHGKPINDILKALECNERLPQPVTVTADLHSILVGCWWLDPMMRPMFTEMVKNLMMIQSNPSQYVLTTVDGKLDTYSKLPPAVLDVSPFENLSEIDGAGYLKMLPVGSVPANSASNRHTSNTLASISSSNVMEDGTVVSTFMSNIRVKDEKYEKVATKNESTVYANPEQQDDIYVNDEDINGEDKKIKTGGLYSTVDQPTQDEVYINPLPTQEQLYSDVGPSDEPELYVDPETMNKTDNQPKDDTSVDEMYVNDTEITKPKPELYMDNSIDDTYVNDTEITKPKPELYMNDNVDEMYVVPSSQTDDQTALLDHEGRGYEKMKKGISIEDINAEYVYTENHTRLNSHASATTEDGYQIMKGSEQIGNSQQPVEDEGYVDVTNRTIGEEGFRESQIYSSVQ